MKCKWCNHPVKAEAYEYYGPGEMWFHSINPDSKTVWCEVKGCTCYSPDNDADPLKYLTKAELITTVHRYQTALHLCYLEAEKLFNVESQLPKEDSGAIDSERESNPSINPQSPGSSGTNKGD